jgi:hypothetical protein
MTLTVRGPMAKKKAAPPGPAGGDEPGGKKTTLKVWEDVARKAKIVAAIRGLDLFEYVDGILRPAVDRDHATAIRDEAAGGG